MTGKYINKNRNTMFYIIVRMGSYMSKNKFYAFDPITATAIINPITARTSRSIQNHRQGMVATASL